MKIPFCSGETKHQLYAYLDILFLFCFSTCAMFIEQKNITVDYSLVSCQKNVQAYYLMLTKVAVVCQKFFEVVGVKMSQFNLNNKKTEERKKGRKGDVCCKNYHYKR